MNKEEISSIIHSLNEGETLQIVFRNGGQMICEIRAFINTDGERLYERKHLIRRMRYYEDEKRLAEWLKIVPPAVAKINLIKERIWRLKA
jgi:hypothetical protein